jgi:hypothetical protein
MLMKPLDPETLQAAAAAMEKQHWDERGWFAKPGSESTLPPVNK